MRLSGKEPYPVVMLNEVKNLLRVQALRWVPCLRAGWASITTTQGGAFRRNRSLFILLCCLTYCSSGESLIASADGFDEAWRWVQFTTESGLPSDRVQDIFETADGTVWAATPSGLAWYDGFQWITIDSNKGLPSNSSVNIFGGPGDSLLVRCGGEFYAGTKLGFRSLDIGIVDAAVSEIDHSLLLLRKASLYRYRNGSAQLVQSSKFSTERKSIALWKTASGRIWADFIPGIYRLEGNEWLCMVRAGPNPFGISALAENASGTGIAVVHFPANQRGLWEWTGDSAPRRNLTEKPDNLKSMDVGPAGEAVIVYQSEEARLRRNGVWSQLEFGQPDIRDIFTVKFRSNGDLWVGTEHGLFLYKRSSSRWTNWRQNSPDLRNSVNEILKTRDGSIWLGTSRGIEIHDATGTREVVAIHGEPLDVVTGLAEDTAGGVWISSGASFSGAFRWNGVRWDHFDVSDDTGGIRIHKIRIDRHGRLWFLGIGKNFPPMEYKQPGAYVLENNHFTRWGKEEGLPHGRVYSFAEGYDGALWFGTFDGLSRWKDGTWTHWSQEQGLRSRRVFTLAVDQNNTVWFADAVERTGLGYLDRHDSVHYYSTADGLVNDKVWDLRVDAFGKLWIATNGGLSCFDSGVWSTFDEKSGLPHSELWPVLPLERYVYVGTMGRGVAILKRDEATNPNPRILLRVPLAERNNVVLRWIPLAFWSELAPADILTRIRINQGTWSAWEKKPEISLHDLDPGEYVYQVQAKGLFGNYTPEGVRGSFFVPLPLHLRPAFLVPTAALVLIILALGTTMLARKRNHDLAIRKSEEKFRTVTEMTSSAIFIYHNAKLLFVNTGTETLTGYGKEELLSKEIFDIVDPSDREMMQERELDRSGNTAVPHRYEIQIRRNDGSLRWVEFTSGWIRYQGMPVRLGTAVDITERKQGEEKLRLLASELSLTEERERRRMASYLHDVIGQTLALCKMKVRGIQRSVTPEGEDSSLQELLELIEQSIHNTQSLTFELCPPILYELSFGAAIEWLTERMQQQSGVVFLFEDDKSPKLLTNDVRVLLFQAVREILVNIIKHAQAHSVRVSLAREHEDFRIEIQDDGIGFDVSKKSAPKEGGFGLFNIRERLTYIGGLLSIESKPGGGTRVTITAPLAENEGAGS